MVAVARNVPIDDRLVAEQLHDFHTQRHGARSPAAPVNEATEQLPAVPDDELADGPAGASNTRSPASTRPSAAVALSRFIGVCP